ncbi:hypothetical protein L0664_16545 [Octadecabacter sp. G9-8]|uniref:Uncharacterized protein n=1 Tax=Octadecabacter dasysiphoniae TaxID=2909341 RepID=A0ABS9D0G9_9RHOB|nr:hypothetical protein [Octadecabacter dasysiphoniae]MCF2872681.1 hypothetical protein [Octadecabacter dasysiphoniae]
MRLLLTISTAYFATSTALFAGSRAEVIEPSGGSDVNGAVILLLLVGAVVLLGGGAGAATQNKTQTDNDDDDDVIMRF